MIGFRHVDPRFPFLRKTGVQPPARWHGAGKGPVHYLAETPDGAWAEFLRHEGIADPADLAGVVGSLWAVESPHLSWARPALLIAELTGDAATYPACQIEARRLRLRRVRGLVAPSAALQPGTAGGLRTDGGLRPARPRPERVVVLFGPRPDLVGWAACAEGRPRADLLTRVRPLREPRTQRAARLATAVTRRVGPLGAAWL